jgi:LacI family transcriptional regulator
MKNNPTISQVAELAGVSRATVSRAFTRPDLISAKTVEKVRKTAQEIGYVPNRVARALSTGRHGNIGLIVPDISNPFFPPLIRSMQREADEASFSVFIGNTDEQVDREDQLAERFVGQVEGLVLCSSRLPEEQVRYYAALRPVVLVNRDIKGIPRVLIDSAAGMTKAVSHLAELGHRSVVYIEGPSTSWSNQQRRLAVRKAAKKLKMSLTSVSANPPGFDAGFLAAGKVLESGATAAIAFDDITAQGIIAGLAKADVSTPDKFSVIGCDDVLGALTHPQLTSVSNSCEEAGRIALHLLKDLLTSKLTSDVRYVLETDLVVRETTAPPFRRKK